MPAPVRSFTYHEYDGFEVDINFHFKYHRIMSRDLSEHKKYSFFSTLDSLGAQRTVVRLSVYISAFYVSDDDRGAAGRREESRQKIELQISNSPRQRCRPTAGRCHNFDGEADSLKYSTNYLNVQ